MFKNIIELGLSKGFSDLELVINRGKSLSLSVYEGIVDEFEQSDSTRLTIIGIYHGKKGGISIENFDEKLFEKYINQLRNNLRAITVKEPVEIYAGSEHYLKVEDNNYDFSKIPFEEKRNYLINLEKEIKKNPHVRTVEATKYQESLGETTLINSKGLNLTKRHNYAMSYAVGVFGSDDDIQSAYKVKAVESFEEFNYETDASEIVELGLKKINSTIPQSGNYEVVFNPETFSNLLAVFQSVFSAEAAYRHLTKLEDKVGEKVFSDLITLIDDPIHPEAYFKQSFDSEGVATSVKTIIDKGVFKGFLHSLKTANIFKTKPTGNNFGSIRPANMYLVPGNQTLDEVIANIEDGIYITDVIGLHAGVNAVSGDFSLQASGLRIENGKITTGLKQMVVSSNLFTMLNQVEAVANDFEFRINPVGTSSVYVGSLQIAGK